MRETRVAETPKIATPEILINIACEGWPEPEELQVLIRRALSSVTRTAGLNFPDGAELSLLFCDDAHISKINYQFRNLNKPTNVLSFPDQEITPGDPAGAMLGDIAFALQTTKNEADLDGKQFEHHLVHLIIHGFLHIFGYDHISDEEAEIMEALEVSALEKLNINNPYHDAPASRKE